MASMSNSPALSRVPYGNQRRVPLGNIPNAANSPRRPSAATKRLRPDPEAKEDIGTEGQRPAKRQALTTKRVVPRTPLRQPAPETGAGVFEERKNVQPTAFERKLRAAQERATRESQPQPKPEKSSKSEEAAAEEIRAWRRSTRRAFPSFVFYFESIPDDTRRRCSRVLKELGAREERFFSREITHVITTRAVPVGSEDTSPTDVGITLHNDVSRSRQTRTVVPAVLERQRPVNPQNGDILARAKDMGMKVWQLEKLHRVLDYLLNDRPNGQVVQGRATRRVGGQTGNAGHDAGEADLSRLLRKERLNGPLDRDNNTVSHEQVTFKGPYLYVRCVDERTKPILLKEYPKVANKEDGDWPQFRACRSGRCPFMDDPDFQAGLLRRSSEGKRPRRSKRKQAEAMVKVKKASAQPAKQQPLGESKNGANCQPTQPEKLPQMDFCIPALPNHKDDMQGSRKPSVHPQAHQRMMNGEPAASGLQPSNITSAIRSQMISSTAAAPGAKGPTSKEVYGLKRRVLEKNCTGQIAPNSIQVAQRQPPYTHNPARAESAIPTREARTRAQQKQIIFLEEEEEEGVTEGPSEAGATACDETAEPFAKAATMSKKVKPADLQPEKQLKPGYCENCRDKYDDFDAHIAGRKHREFALTQSNWSELDKLLDRLDRPLKVNSSLVDEDSTF